MSGRQMPDTPYSHGGRVHVLLAVRLVAALTFRLHSQGRRNRHETRVVRERHDSVRRRRRHRGGVALALAQQLQLDVFRSHNASVAHDMHRSLLALRFRRRRQPLRTFHVTWVAADVAQRDVTVGDAEAARAGDGQRARTLGTGVAGRVRVALRLRVGLFSVETLEGQQRVLVLLLLPPRTPLLLQ